MEARKIVAFKTEAEEAPVDDWNVVVKQFRCPYRTEQGAKCKVHQERLSEVLNHFYWNHFERTAKDSVFDQHLTCFYADCHSTFLTHEKLAKHMHTHDGGANSLHFIKFIMDGVEKAKNEAVAKVNLEMEEKTELNCQEKLKMDETVKKAEKDLEKSKSDVRHYRRKSDNAKRENVKLESELKETKEDLRGIRLSDDKRNKELLEKNTELKTKWSILKTENEYLKTIASAHEACGDTNAGEKVKKLEKTLKRMMESLQEKDAIINAQNSKMTKLSFPDFVEEQEMEMNGEYVEN